MIGIGNAIGFASLMALLLGVTTLIILPSCFVSVLNKYPGINKTASYKKAILLVLSYISFACFNHYMALQLLMINLTYVLGWVLMVGLGIFLLNWFNRKNLQHQ